MASRSDIRAGGAYMELYVLDDAMVAGLNAAQAYLEGFGRTIQALGLRIGAIGAVFTVPFALAVSTASTLQQAIRKFDVVFGHNADSVRAWGDTFAGQIGRSKREITGFLSRMQSLFVPLGFDEATATTMSKQITQLTVDLAAFGDMADADVMRDLDSALTGSGEVMKKHHVLLNAATTAQELFNRGIDPKNATDQQKVLARLAIILRDTAYAHGHAARNAGTYAGQTKAMKADVEDLRGALGEGLLPVIAEQIGLVRQLVRGFTQWVKANQETVVFVAKLAAGLAVAGAVIYGIGTAIVAVGAVFGAAASIITIFGTAFGMAAAAVGFLLSPMGLVLVALTGLAAYAVYASGVIGWLGGVFQSLKEDAIKVWGGIANALMAGDIELAANVLWAGLKLEWQKGVNVLEGVWEDFKQFFIDIGWMSPFIDGLAVIKSAWAEMIGWLAKKWTEFNNSSFVEEYMLFIAPVLAAAKGISTEEARERITYNMANRREAMPDVQGEIDADTERQKRDIEAARRNSQADMANNKANRATREAMSQLALDAAQADLDALIAEAAGKRKDADKRRGELPGYEMPGGVGGQGGIPTAGDIKRTAVGTFSAGQAALLGGGGLQQRMLGLTEKLLEESKERRKLDKLMLLEQKRLTLEATA